MRLIDLEPKFIGSVVLGHPRHGIGIYFLCPTCRADKVCVMFENPIDGGPPFPAKTHWRREGETLDTLTLSPSVDASGCCYGKVSGVRCSGWHGNIVAGMVV